MVSPDTILMYEEDQRKPLDSSRERTFHQGWEDALDDGPYTEGTFNKLSWQNLGNRFGCLFGDVPEEMRDELMFWAERQRRLD
ncbi:hypothetical protein [Natronorubrum sulfidifaciens]|uniref:Uncharacterized protein n=1 Tax=Natronorubrum sulfidifaciens JCM 14089 TaxID=1230460 RepID=L9WCT6_9EURY|nr:hypothetical protein [Natronorubrum sulfidifaciens]ELY47310.1 hypothetical protein C495_03592 [Natronorubrum sulfidifaciens JCM 14089]